MDLQEIEGGLRMVDSRYFNKKAQANVFVLLMIGIVFFVLGLALTPGATDVTNEAMSSEELNCSNASITDQDQAVCASLDVMPPLYFGTILGLAGVVLAGAILR